MNGISREPTELEKELNEIRGTYEAYRHETGIDNVKRQEELARYQRDVNQLTATVAKANAKIAFLEGQ